MDEAIPAWRQVNDVARVVYVESVRHSVRIAGILCLVLTAGCATVEKTPPSVAAQPDALSAESIRPEPVREDAIAAEPPRAEPIQEALAPAPPPAAPREPATTADAASANTQGTGAAAPYSTIQGAAQPPAKERAKVPVSAAALEPPRRHESPPPATLRLEPPLDVAALKARLRDTSAIGVFTKLALRNQVDDLLQRFRAHYLSGQKTDIAALRQPYDLLVLKVLALIQDGDPSLARTISGSREAIWGILADPEKFNSAS